MERDDAARLVKRMVTLSDGRYLIYYDFPAPDSPPSAPEKLNFNEPEER